VAAFKLEFAGNEPVPGSREKVLILIASRSFAILHPRSSILDASLLMPTA
jgi:hypothetical protein